MSYPENYNTTPLAPIISIYDYKFNTKFRWEHPQLLAKPRQDFNLNSWKISAGINSNVGSAEITIKDFTNELTDNTPRSTPKIRAGDLMQIYLGKDQIQSWYFGICDEPELIRGGYNQQLLRIRSIGYGIRLTSRFIKIDHVQALTEDGVLDQTDENSKVSEIVKRVLTDDSLFLIPPHDDTISIDPIINTDPISGITTTEGGIEDVDVKLSAYSKLNRTQAAIIAELANVSNCVYGIDPDLNFYFRPSNTPSSLTVTNDLVNKTDPTRQVYMRNKKYSFQDSTVRNAHTNLIGTDVTHFQEHVADTGGNRFHSGNQLQNTTAWEIPAQAMPHIEIFIKRFFDEVFVPLRYIGLRNPSGDGIILPIDTANYIGNWKEIPIEQLEKVSKSDGQWLKLDLAFPTPATNERFYLLLQRTNPSAGNDSLQIGFKENGNRGYKTFSSLSFTEAQADIETNHALRVKSTTDRIVRLIAQNTTLKHQQLVKENIQNLRQVETEASSTRIFEGLMDLAGRVRRKYSDLLTSVPETRPPLGKLVHIVDTFNKINSYALLVGYDIGSDTSQNLTTNDISLELEEWL